MSKFIIRDQAGLHFTTSTVVGWIDIFSRKRYRDIVLKSLQFCKDHKSLHIFAYVIMSNHIHLVIQAGQPDQWSLSDILRDFKKFTAKSILDSMRKEPESRREWLMHMFKYYAKYNTNNREFQFWKQYNHPVELTSLEMAWQKINYIHRNPIKAGLVDKPEDFVYSSARNYLRDNQNCLIEIELMRMLW